MLRSVELDSELCFSAHEIRNVSADPDLTTELQAFKAAVAENVPETAFGFRGRLAPQARAISGASSAFMPITL